jgi:hypothetical protein
MTADELQRLASILRWVGLSVTALGLLITFGSHYVADKLLVVQRGEKIKSAQRLQISEAELEITKAKTAELEFKLSPRILTEEQRKGFLAFVANTPKGKVSFKCVSNSKEACDYAAVIKDLLATARFDVAASVPSYISTGIRASGISMSIRSEKHQPAHAGEIQKGFESIGIPMPGTVDTDDQSLSEDMVVIYVGAKS